MVEIRTKVLREIEWDCISCGTTNTLYSRANDTELWCSYCAAIHSLDKIKKNTGISYQVRLLAC